MDKKIAIKNKITLIMINTKRSFLLLLCLCLAFSFQLNAQNTASGTVVDGDSGETLIGVNILVQGTVQGTITDLDGNFSLDVTGDLPYTLAFSLVGYAGEQIEVNESNTQIDLQMYTASIIADEVVVSASRTPEKILESPVTIEKLDAIALRQASTADFYDEITRLKGVHSNQASLTFNTINTRGFATAGNTRFVQLQDGMDNAAPLLNFPTGNVVGISELDIKNVELVPGAASALYGPNAFNGILLMTSKSPFDYQGLSVQLKSGIIDGARINNAGNTVDSYSDPFYGASIRYAKAFNDKFAFKLNASAFIADDWRANDYEGHRIPGEDRVAGDADFDGMNLYGDETLVVLAPGVQARRTGFREEDLIESSDAESFKLDAALHYRITDNLETNVSYKYGAGSSVYQGAERYALRDFIQQFVKFELNSSKWNIRAYRSMTDDGDSYNLTALGAFTNENLFPSAVRAGGQVVGGWFAAYSQALGGAFNVFGIPGGDPGIARSFADQGGLTALPDAARQGFVQNLISQGVDPATAQFILGAFSGIPIRDGNGDLTDAALEQIDSTRIKLFQRGGAGFIDDSNLSHLEGNYDLSSITGGALGIQIGANYRQYDLFTDGTVFNEDPEGDGVNERIKINEWGAYMQLSKKLANDRLKLTGSIRYDKNENFDGIVSPRISAVFTSGEDRQHNFRGSFQTGFRNPTTQGQFIYFPTTSILLGGTESNASRYGVYNGGAWTEASYFASLATGDPSVREVINLEYVQPEKLQSIELGYKGIINKKVLIDLHGYYNTYSDFIDQINVVNIEPTSHKGNVIPTGTTFRPYFNVPVDISSTGFALGVDYIVTRNWKVSGNYAYADFSVDESVVGTAFEDYQPGFNTPKHKINIGLFNRKVIDNLSFGVNFRWQDEHFYISSFGEGIVPSFTTADAQVSYKLDAISSNVKLGVTNIFKNVYRTNIGNPFIGRTVHLTITYDQFAN
jgi:outer membrane receptor protein involved in Fe transport